MVYLRGSFDGTSGGMLLSGLRSGCGDGASKVRGDISRRGGGDIDWSGEGVALEGLVGGEIGICGGGSITPR